MNTKWLMLGLLVGILVIAGLAHGWNMHYYPFLENDEGVYVSQAWSLFENGEMSPYYYWYDHAPGGWIFLGIFIKLTGGYFTFGHSVASGRVFMLLLQIASTYFLFEIVRHLVRSRVAAVIAAGLFALSPLAIYFHRRVLLDNMMVFWLLAAIFVLVRKEITLPRAALAGLLFGIACVTKENAVFFGPAFLFLFFTNTHWQEGLRKMLLWCITAGSVIILYPLYALTKSELFYDSANPDRISLIGTLKSQLERGTDLPFWHAQSDFMVAFNGWASTDPVILYAGIVCSVVLIGGAFFHKLWRVPAVFVFLAWLFFLRGGIVLPFYIPTLIPFLAIAVGIVIAGVFAFVSRGNGKAYFAGTALCGLLVIGFSVSQSAKQYTHDEVSPGLQALAWLEKNAEPTDRIIIDQAYYVDLHHADLEKVFVDADWFWKSDYDPSVRTEKYEDSWQNVDYVLATHETLAQSGWGSVPFTKSVMENADIIEQWGPYSDDTQLDFENFTSSNGDWAVIYKVRK